jgi:hypothetical protein
MAGSQHVKRAIRGALTPKTRTLSRPEIDEELSTATVDPINDGTKNGTRNLDKD